MTPNNINDDLYWLYGSLYFKCNVFTNSYMLGYQVEINKWLKYYNNIAKQKVIYDICLDENYIHIIANNQKVCIYNCVDISI
jgi:hypothetical protein